MPPPLLSQPEVTAARRIGALRSEHGLTLQELAGMTGLSAGYLSRVENLKTSVTLSNLSRIADAFAVDVSAFFRDDPGEKPLVLCRESDRRPVRLRHREGIRAFLLAFERRQKLMEPLVVDVSSSKGRLELKAHPGEEFLLVLEGECRFGFGREELRLRKGDALYFDPSVEHGVASVGTKGGWVLSVVTSRDFHLHGGVARFAETLGDAR